MNKMFKSVIVALACLSVAFAIPIEEDGWRVVGGIEAKPGEFKFICSLRVSGRHNCGCSIIRRQWVLTAAHCVRNSNAATLTIQAGTTKLDDQNAVVVAVAEIIVHPDDHPSDYTNDIALLKLQEEIELDPESIATIDLQCVDDREKTGDCILIGWGTTRYGGPTPNDLQKLNSTFLTVENCQERLSGTSPKVVDTEICTFTKRDEGACHGDSGGPLIVRKEGKQDKLAGVVSWGRPCAVGYPDVFTRVSSFCEWTTSVIDGDQ